MPSSCTPNYALSQWEKTDQVRMEDFNADNAKIDAAIAGKADGPVVAGLVQTAAEHAAALNGKGNCQIYTSSYVGSGRYGSSGPTTLRFPRLPAVAFVTAASGMGTVLIPGQSGGFSYGTSGMITSVSWSGDTVRFFNHQSAAAQLNESGTTYYVVALLSAG